MDPNIIEQTKVTLFIPFHENVRLKKSKSNMWLISLANTDCFHVWAI